MRHSFKHLLLSTAALAGMASAALANDKLSVPDRTEPVPPYVQRDTEGVGITEHLGATVPLDLAFTDSTGHSVKLADYFHKGRPVILQLGYFNCPQLCDVVSKALMDGVRDLPLTMGTDYDVLFVSVNPTERWELGQKKKRTYVEEYGKPGAIDGWNFLVGQEDAIAPLAQAVGFGYRKIPGRDEYSHPPVIVVLTGEGKISQYFYNWQYPSAGLQKAINDAKDEKVGQSLGQILISFCYHLDEYSGKYSLQYMHLMQAGGVLTVLVLGSWLGFRWLRDAKGGRSAKPSTHPR